MKISIKTNTYVLSSDSPRELLPDDLMHRTSHIVALNRIRDIVNGKPSIIADTALRLGRYFSVAPDTWLCLQADYDLRVANARSGSRWSRACGCMREKAEIPGISN